MLRERVVIGLLAVSVAVGAGIALVELTSVGLSTWGYAVSLVGFFVVAPAVIVRHAYRREWLSPLPAVTGFFILEFAAGAIFYRNPRIDSVLGDLLFAYTPGSIGVALAIAFASWALLVAGYYLSAFIDRPLARLPRPRANDIVTGTAIVLFLVGAAARVLMVSNGWYFHISDDAAAQSGLRNVVVVVAGLPLVATAMIGARYYRERRTSPVLFWTLVLEEVAWAGLSGARHRLVALGLMLLVVRTYASAKRFPAGRAVLFGVTAVLVIFPLGAAYRNIGASTSNYNDDPVGQLKSASVQMLANYERNPLDAVSNGVEQTLQRFAGVTSLAAIAHRGPADYPARANDALAAYAGAFVPRALLPSKVDASTLTTEFGYRYSIIRPGNTTSVAMTNIGDLWGTFGLGGLAIGMLLIGGVVRGLNVYLKERRENYAILGIYAAILGSFLLSFETSIATGLLQTLRTLVIYVVAVGLASATVRVMRGIPAKSPARPGLGSSSAPAQARM